MDTAPNPFDAVDPTSLRQSLSTKWRKYTDDVLPAWVADMDFPIAEPITEALRRVVDGQEHRYPDPSLRTDVVEALVKRVAARYSLVLDPERVVVPADVVQALYATVFAFSAPGDGVVVLTPVYPPFLDAVGQQGRTLIDHRLHVTDGRYRFDPHALRTQLANRNGAPAAKVLLLCQPHNPVGRVFTRDELRSLADIALEFDLVIVSDEIHADLVFEPHRHVSIATLGPEVAGRTVTLYSASKAFNLAGLRCAFMAFGSAELHDRFNDALPAKVLGAVSTAALVATHAAWTHGDGWLADCLAHLDDNRCTFAAALMERAPCITHHMPEATYLCWLDLRACVPAGTTAGAALLQEVQLAANDGPTFGSGLDGYARINIATSRPLLVDIIDRLVTFAGRS